MQKYLEPSFTTRCNIVRKMYLENDEFHDYVERSCRSGRYSIDEFLLTHEAYDQADYLIHKY